MTDYPRWLKARRLEAGLTAREFGELAGVDRSTISRAEKFGHASARTRELVDRALLRLALQQPTSWM